MNAYEYNIIESGVTTKVNPLEYTILVERWLDENIMCSCYDSLEVEV